jgi:DNA repair protein RecN (Recombination protein N)
LNIAMLSELTIRNFAIIEDLTIQFDPGLTILSGETGAGKSIIINAVNLLLGSRASANLIRTGADSAELEALFVVPRDGLLVDIMKEGGLDPEDGLMVRRIISKTDRHRIYINGRLSTMQFLSSLTAHLASISGQHAHQGLLKEETHLDVLDQFGELMPLRGEYIAAFRKMQSLLDREKALLHQQAHQAEQIELLRFQRQEIEAAALVEGEDRSLEKEKAKLKNGELLYQNVQECVEGLYSKDGAVVEHLGQMAKMLDKTAQIDGTLSASASDLTELVYQAEALAMNLRDYLTHIDLDPRRLEAVDDRLDQLNRLKRKYGGSVRDVIDYHHKIDGQLRQTEDLDDVLDRVREELRECHTLIIQLAKQLTQGRLRAAKTLSRLVEAELASLKMSDSRFDVQLQTLPAGPDHSPFLSYNGNVLGETGLERAAFMLAPNVGEAIKPLAAIASGGELSRVVLALKAILAQTDAVETVVFDEVDAGIGGGIAEVVGKKLELLAHRHQILCITHLPQIAKYGEHHFFIRKKVVGGRTHTTILPLDSKARIEEIARMLGGEEITATTRKHARELLSQPKKNA